MEKPLLRTLLILTGIATFSLAALSSEPARCWSNQQGDARTVCLAKAQLNLNHCDRLQDPVFAEQCKAAVQSSLN